MPIGCRDVVVFCPQVRSSNNVVHVEVTVVVLCQMGCETYGTSVIQYKAWYTRRKYIYVCIHVHATWHPQWYDARFELWILCCCVTSIILIHDLVTPSECSWNQISVVIDMAQWGHASALAALQRLGRRLSLRDGFRGCEEAPSRQPDASKTLLHTFHLSTAWPRHEGIQMKRMGSTVVCRISILFKMTFDT